MSFFLIFKIFCNVVSYIIKSYLKKCSELHKLYVASLCREHLLVAELCFLLSGSTTLPRRF